MPHSPGVLDFAFVLVNSVVNLPDKWGQVSFFGGGGGGVVWVGWGYSNYRRTVMNPAYQRFFGGELQLTPSHQKDTYQIFLPQKTLG